ncbi:MAG TPA: hypothetical protein VIT88_11315, partial [Pyrinomonadaceae bacterium]
MNFLLKKLLRRECVWDFQRVTERAPGVRHVPGVDWQLELALQLREWPQVLVPESRLVLVSELPLVLPELAYVLHV